MFLLLLACADDPKLDDSAWVDDTAAPDDSAAPGPWTELTARPDWESELEGYGTGLVWADIDGDGDGDLVVAYGNDMRPGPLVVYLNRDGQLDAQPSWRSDSDHYHGHIAAGDLNGDGLADLAVSRFLGEGRFEDPGGVFIYINRGGELEGSPSWSSPEDFFTFSCALGDVDNDGDLDLAAAVGEAYYNAPDVSRVYLNDGAGDFGGAAAWTTEQPRHSFDVAWFDLDQNGWLDLAFANGGSPHSVYLNQGGQLESTPAWEASGAPETFEGNTLDWGDVNGDGWLDLAVSDNSQLGGTGTVSLFCGPTLERCWESADPAAYQSAVSIEDVDGDGAPELVAGAWWGEVRLYPNDGGLAPEPAWTSSTTTVIEAFGWQDSDGSHDQVVTLEGEGLVQVPGRGRVLSVQGGVAGDGWISGPGTVRAEVLAPAPRDLAVSNWDRDIGDQLFLRRAP